MIGECFDKIRGEIVGNCKITAFVNSPLCIFTVNRVRSFRGRVSNFNQSEARKLCFSLF